MRSREADNVIEATELVSAELGFVPSSWLQSLYLTAFPGCLSECYRDYDPDFGNKKNETDLHKGV